MSVTLVLLLFKRRKKKKISWSSIRLPLNTYVIIRRSCRGQEDKTTDLHIGGSGFESQPGSTIKPLGKALYSHCLLPVGQDLNRLVPRLLSYKQLDVLVAMENKSNYNYNYNWSNDDFLFFTPSSTCFWSLAKWKICLTPTICIYTLLY